MAGTGGDTSSTAFLRDLCFLLDNLSDEAWSDVERRKNEKLMLDATKVY